MDLYTSVCGLEILSSYMFVHCIVHPECIYICSVHLSPRSNTSIQRSRRANRKQKRKKKNNTLSSDLQTKLGKLALAFISCRCCEYSSHMFRHIFEHLLYGSPV